MDFPAVDLKHRALLLKVGQRFSYEDMDGILFLCEGVLSESTTEKIKSPTALFRGLEHRSYLAPGNYTFLKGCLMSIGRVDLADMLPTKADQLRVAFSDLNIDNSKKSSPGMEKKKVLNQISSKLRREDLDKMAYLCSCEVKGGLELMQTLEKRGLIHEQNYDYLIEILAEIGRCDLSNMLQSDHLTQVPSGMNAPEQALVLMAEAMREKHKNYASQVQIVTSIANGNDKILHDIVKNQGINITTEMTLSTGKASLEKPKELLPAAFNSLQTLLGTLVMDIKTQKCWKSFQSRVHPQSTSYETHHHLCLLGASAYTANEYIDDVSKELIGIESNSLPSRVKNIISICSKCVYYTPLLLKTLNSFLHGEDIDINVFHDVLTAAFLEHREYITALLPIITQFILPEKVQMVYKALGVIMPRDEDYSSNTSMSFYGYLMMITVPTYTLLLYLLSACHGQVIANTSTITKVLVEYIEDSRHYNGDAGRFLISCGQALQTEIINYREKLLDNCQFPMIRELLI